MNVTYKCFSILYLLKSCFCLVLESFGLLFLVFIHLVQYELILAPKKEFLLAMYP